MDTFRTEIRPTHAPYSVGYTDPMLFIGSCFTEYIGKKLESLKFPLVINPSGILYNPVSIAECLQRLVTAEKYTAEDLIFYNNIWHSFDHHGKFSGTDKNFVLRQINEALVHGSTVLQKAAFLFVTFGNAHVYRYKKTGKIVANCHKIPDTEFQFEMLSPGQIIETFNLAWQNIRRINPSVRLIFSISPVRYLRYGHTANQMGKSILFVAVHELLNEIPESVYFPAYEIMMDDLRDYRFYEPDMVHPNQVAVDYIWQYFCDTFFDETTLQLIRKIEQVVRALEHKPILPDTREFRQFIESTENRIRELEKQYPFLNFNDEKEKLRMLKPE